MNLLQEANGFGFLLSGKFNFGKAIHSQPLKVYGTSYKQDSDSASTFLGCEQQQQPQLLDTELV